MEPKRIPVEADLSLYNPPIVMRQGLSYRDGAKGLGLPYDVPLYCRTHRLMSGEKPSALKGWTTELNAFTFGVDILVRIGMDHTLKVFERTSDGVELLTSYIKEQG